MMLMMLGISLSIIKKFQTKQQSERFSILNQQFAMSVMMAIAFAYTYLTAMIVNANEIFKQDLIITTTKVATITSFIITMPLITASLVVILRSFGMYSDQSAVAKARQKDRAVEKVSFRRSTLSSVQPPSTLNESQDLNNAD